MSTPSVTCNDNSVPQTITDGAGNTYYVCTNQANVFDSNKITCTGTTYNLCASNVVGYQNVYCTSDPSTNCANVGISGLTPQQCFNSQWKVIDQETQQMSPWQMPDNDGSCNANYDGTDDEGGLGNLN